MYVAGGADSYTNVLINSSDFYDILMRIELVTRVAKHDNDELNELLDQYKKPSPAIRASVVPSPPSASGFTTTFASGCAFTIGIRQHKYPVKSFTRSI